MILVSHRIYEQKREYDPLTSCPGMLEVVEQSDPIWLVRCDRCEFEAGLPAREVSAEQRRRARMDRAGFPARYVAARFEQDADNFFAIEAVRNWVADYKTLPLPAPAIWGDGGRGKTHLLVELGRQLIESHEAAVMFRSISRLLDELQQDMFDEHRSHRQLWDRVLSTPVLLLDDVGAERGTDWRVDRLARLVDERYEQELPVVIATNYKPDSWERVLDERTRSRLRGMTFAIELTGADRRIVPIASKRRSEEEVA